MPPKQKPTPLQVPAYLNFIHTTFGQRVYTPRGDADEELEEANNRDATTSQLAYLLDDAEILYSEEEKVLVDDIDIKRNILKTVNAQLDNDLYDWSPKQLESSYSKWLANAKAQMKEVIDLHLRDCNQFPIEIQALANALINPNDGHINILKTQMISLIDDKYIHTW